METKPSVKKIFRRCFPLLLTVLFTTVGCGGAESSPAQSSNDSAVDAGLCSIKTSLWVEDCPLTYSVSSREELETLDREYYGMLTEGLKEQGIFDDADSFFQDHQLLVAVLTAGSGADDYKLTSLSRDENGAITMHVSETKPTEASTADVCTWFLAASLDRDQTGDEKIQDFSVSIG